VKGKTIISASRRTDLPQYYTSWLVKQFQRGYAEVINPVNKKVFRVLLNPEAVHSVVFWSKNFSNLINELEKFRAYELFFMFTINSPSELEPFVPSLKERFDQLEFLIKKFSVRRIFMRFDPIVFWKKDGKIINNLTHFDEIINKLSKFGICGIKTSFADLSYKKLKKRKVEFYEPSYNEKIALVHELSNKVRQYGIYLEFCCNDYIFSSSIPENVKKAKCIDGNLISNIVGEPAILKKDPSQRKECICTYSRDIGSYNQQCLSGCKYCYGNPKLK